MPRILLIDDDALLRRMLRLTLESLGHTVDEAADGDEGLARFGAEPPDLVLTDLIMPGKEGMETIIELRRDYPDVKVIAMSGGRSGVIEFLKAARLLGAAAILQKPFTTEVLAAAIATALAPPAAGGDPAP